MPQHLLCFPYSVTYNLCHSILCPLSLVHLSVLCHSVTLSPSFPSFVLCHPPSLLSISLSSNSLPLCPILFLSSQHPFITPCLSVPTSSTLHSVPCDSVSHFLHSLYYPICHTTPSLVIYKSFQLVVYSLASNCHPLLPTQSPLSLPLVSYYSPSYPLCLPCLSSLKLRTPLFLGEGATHKLKPSPYPYAAVFHNPYTALHAPHTTPLTFPLHLPDSGIALTLSLPHSISYSVPAFIPSLPQHSTSCSYYS